MSINNKEETPFPNKNTIPKRIEYSEQDKLKETTKETPNQDRNSNQNQGQDQVPPISPNLNLLEDIKDDDFKAEDEFKNSTAELKKNLIFDQKNISVFRLYWHLSKRFEVFIMFLAVIGSFGSGCAGPLMALLSGDTISKMTPTAMGNIDIIRHEHPEFFIKFTEVINTMVTKFLAIGAGMFFGYFLMNSMWNLAALRQVQHLKEQYFAIILHQEQGWFDSNNSYEFSTKVQAQLEQIELGVGERFGQILQSIAQLICGLIIAFTSSWKLTLAMLTISPLIVIDMVILVTSLKNGIILSRKTYEKAGGIAEELLYNIKTVASFANFDYETKRFNKYIDQVNYYDKLAGLKLAACVGFLIFFVNTTFVVALVYGRVLITDSNLSLNGNGTFKSGNVLTVMFATLLAIMSLANVGPSMKTIQEACVAASDYFTLVDRVPQLDLSNSKLKPDKENIIGRIELKNIDFLYPSDLNKRKILDNLSIVFEPGKKIALVGESGCGKSTVVNLIERLYDPIQGDVFIDGINIKNYDLFYLRSLIGYVQQEPVLFNKSIKENIIFGREESIKSIVDNTNINELIADACEEAYASEFINKYPEKYEYKVGIKGSKLSGGQKQRIAIARAILCKPKILLLDEATSALDTVSEKEVQRALDRISAKNVTTIIIAHRLSTIKNADIIYAIREGKICEQGTHIELLAKNGYYAGLVKSQLSQKAEFGLKETVEKPLSQQQQQQQQQQSKNSSETSIKTIPFKAPPASNRVIPIDNNTTTQVTISPVNSNSKSQGEEVKFSRWRIFTLLKNNKLILICASIGSALQGGLTPVSGLLLAKGINALSQKDNTTIMNDGLLYSMLFLVLALVEGSSVFLKIWEFTAIGSELTTIMRKRIIEKYLKLHIGFFDITENSPGALLTRLSIDTTQLNTLILELLGDLVSVLFNVLITIILALIFDWRLALIGVCFIPLMGIAYSLQNQANRGGREVDKKTHIEAGSILSECVVNSKTIFSFNFQTEAVSMYVSVFDESKKKFMRDSLLTGFLLGLGTFASYCLSATLYKVSSKFIEDGTLSFENMILCMNILITCANGLGNSLQNIGNMSKASNSFKSLFSILDTKSLIDVTNEGNATKATAQSIQGKIEFKNVSFAYPTREDHKILRNVSFTIEPGQSAALVGYSGCGKSTIIQLLERFYDIDEGEILIDGINIRDYNIIELRKQIGLVSQEPVLFKRSVYQNILYGNLISSKEDVYKAAQRACITKFFTKEDNGTKKDPVSGGEKQRLAIGRAFLKNPTILLLDEATSALDKESEKEVQKSIYELQKQRTSIAVAHRLCTIEKSDVIFVLEAGKIVEKGTHQELLALKQKYYTLHKTTDTEKEMVY